MNYRMSEGYRQYVEGLDKEFERLYNLSEKAREKGLDPSLKPESKIAKDLADLVEGLVGPPGVAESIRALSDKLPREELAFKVAEQIVYGKFGHLEEEQAAEQAVRTALAIFTEGLTAAPIQGIAKVKIKLNGDRTRYLAIYFAGPIRSAGGTDQALTLVVGDFVRGLLGLDRYKPTEQEISRFIEELRIYERSSGMHFQYHVTDGELKKALEWLPVEVTGTESDPIEVSTYRNLPRIETNRVRGGALRVVNDGIVGRAQKVRTIIEKLGFQGWDWLEEVRGKTEKKSDGFMDDVIAGRPVFCFASRRGGFRLRYGRARNTGLSAVGIHPVTMLVLKGFLAGGTQLRMELPGKGGVSVPVDSIDGPIVRLNDGTVLRVLMNNYHSIKDRIERILFLGDILISFGDFLYNSKTLPPSGYVEEWWVEDLRSAIADRCGGKVYEAAAIAGLPAEELRGFLADSQNCRPSFRETLTLSSKLHVPLHPMYTFFWSNLTSIELLEQIRTWLFASEIQGENKVANRICGEMNSDVKRGLELICLPHEMREGKVIIEGDDAAAFASCLGYGTAHEMKPAPTRTVLEAIEVLSGIKVKDKAPTYVGARMGRPEKAKRREMKPLVHALFPVGLAGGSQRDIIEAARHGPTFVEITKRKCPNCKTYTSRVKCPLCGSETIHEMTCPRCRKNLKTEDCPVCRTSGVKFQKQVINFKEALDKTCSGIGVSVPKILKGVKGLTNATKTPEIFEKGVLRAKHDLSVYKDGTIRFDATNAPLTHIKPEEIGVPVNKLRDLGYAVDIQGAPLTDASQICELRLQDVVIPVKAAEYFIRVATFIDELLAKVYGLPAFYNVKREEDLLGHLVFGLAPHTCVGILGRIVGFTKLSLCYAHPIWQSAKRRDCDGDEDALILALDGLLNFSKEYLPAQIGGIMDAPLLTPVVNPKEVQRQAHDFDVAGLYPLEFYERTLQKKEARQVSHLIDLVSYRLGTEAQFEGFKFTMAVEDINACNVESAYKKLKSMTDKLESQLELAGKIEAVDASRVALKVLKTHFMRDIMGNLRAFSTQGFRCKACSRRFRRLPLRGACPSCGGALTLTVYRGGIEKYLEAADKLVEEYGLPNYYSQRIALAREEITALFDGKKPKQISLTDFA
jgi:DNA polymerase II large subunit